jgi:hypothetical protein
MSMEEKKSKVISAEEAAKKFIDIIENIY